MSKSRMAARELTPPTPSATEASVETILDADYWRRLVPFLHLGELDRSALGHAGGGPTGSPLDVEHLLQQRRMIVENGYCVAATAAEHGEDCAENLDQLLVDKLAFAGSVLEYHGWPTTFLAIYDETWALAQQCQDWMDRLTDAAAGKRVRNEFCMDIVGFNVVDGVGFSPHRDRQPEDWVPKGHADENPRSTFDNGFARYITCWVALSDAHTGNSCLHYLSATADPGYWAGDSLNDDPMARAFGGTKNCAFQHIRACPVKKGGMVAHTHRVIHWGNQGERDKTRLALDWQRSGCAATVDSATRGRSTQRMHHVAQLIRSGALPHFADQGALLKALRALPPNPCRCALSFSFSNNRGASFEPPYLAAHHLPLPAFELRAAICAAQILNYSTLAFGDPRGFMTLAGRTLKRKHLLKLYEVFKRHSSSFAKHYFDEITSKFAAVSLNNFSPRSTADPPQEQVATTTTTKPQAKPKPRQDLARNRSPAPHTGKRAKRDAQNGSVAPSIQRRAAEVQMEVDDQGSGSELGDADLDAALDAMLQAEEQSQNVLFHDDFDLMLSEGKFDGSAAFDGGACQRTKGASKRTSSSKRKAPSSRKPTHVKGKM